MNAVLAYWSQLGAEQAALLPALALMQWWLRLGWGVVLGALLIGVLAWLFRDLTLRTRTVALRTTALLVLVSCSLPGAWSPSYWLGLAFQAPSLSAGAVSVLLLLRHGIAGQSVSAPAAEMLQQARRWAPLALLLGWVLLLDTFAIWPLALYPLGFGALVWVLLLVLALLPWAWYGGALRRNAAGLLWAAVLLLFATLRLSSGNVWDAMLDPWLWALCHGVCLVDGLRCYKKRSSMRIFRAGL